MNTTSIETLARNLTVSCKTNDPFRICRELGVFVEYKDLGTLKGMYVCILGSRFVVIGEKLDSRMKRIVCAHELGHDQLHREFANDALMKEFMLFDMTCRPEYEANVFAASLLLPSDAVMTCASYGWNASQIAAELNSDENLVKFKMREMSRGGYRLRPCEQPKSDFLR